MKEKARILRLLLLYLYEHQATNPIEVLTLLYESGIIREDKVFKTCGRLEQPDDDNLAAGLVKEGARLKKTTSKTIREIYDELCIPDNLGWSTLHWQRKVTDELDTEGGGHRNCSMFPSWTSL